MKTPTMLQRSVLIFLLLSASQLRADTWFDPSWKEMLDHSDVVALIRYTSNGDFRATATILSMYKGSLKQGDEIGVSGFSNRYGPIDKMKKGNTYIVFLRQQKPNTERISYYNDLLKKDKRQKGFINAYKNGRAYSVTTPTSGDLRVKGDKVQYDLLQTTFYRNQEFHSLPLFEKFLHAYFDKSKASSLCEQLLLSLKPVSENQYQAQCLQQLALLGYPTYDPIFEEYSRVTNNSSRFALAQVAGNIQSDESQRLLIKLIEDKNSLVQGEAVRQLKSAPAEIVGPIFLANLKKANGANFGPSNIMDPVRNQIDGGQREIIYALGELNYQPAAPELLSLLDTENEDQFSDVISALKKMNNREYTKYINKHLDNKTHNLIFRISMMIAEDSLTECLPSFKNFISTCNRNDKINFEYTLHECCGIAHFKDPATINFLLSDYDHFHSYKDTLTSRNVESWTRSYIETFTELKVKEARPLIYRSIHDWMGVNEDFTGDPKLFHLKKRLEDSLTAIITHHPAMKGFKVDGCIAFIENTSDIIKKQKPEFRYIIQVTVPATKEGEKYRELLSWELRLPINNVYVRYSDDVYYLGIQDRFDRNIRSTPLYYFLAYAEELPNSQDVVFFQSLLDNNFLRDEDKDDVSETIEKIKGKLR